MLVANDSASYGFTLAIVGRGAGLKLDIGAIGQIPDLSAVYIEILATIFNNTIGRVAAIRRELDTNGFQNTIIMSYAAKYASAFYGPFREAAESTPCFGDRCSYQLDPPNLRQALYEVEMDIQEGADIIMVKPALAYLDIIAQVRQRFHVPIAAFNVSGEFAMIKAAAEKDWLDEEACVREVLTAIKRAGADLIVTYHAKEVALWLKSGTLK